MVSPSSDTPQPTETSMGSTYLRILGDVMGRFSPSEKMSEVFSKLAERLKEKENRVTSTTIETLNAELPLTESEAQPHCTKVTAGTQLLVSEEIDTTPKLEREAEPEGERESEERVHNKEKEKDSTRKVIEVVSVELDGDLNEEEEEGVSERARRRSSRTQQRMDREELRSMREEATVLAATKREAAERKKKGKYVESPSKGKKPKPVTLGVVIREVDANPSRGTHCQEDEQYIGAFGRQEIDLDKKALEDMVKLILN